MKKDMSEDKLAITIVKITNAGFKYVMENTYSISLDENSKFCLVVNNKTEDIFLANVTETVFPPTTKITTLKVMDRVFALTTLMDIYTNITGKKLDFTAPLVRGNVLMSDYGEAIMLSEDYNGGNYYTGTVINDVCKFVGSYSDKWSFDYFKLSHDSIDAYFESKLLKHQEKSLAKHLQEMEIDEKFNTFKSKQGFDNLMKSWSLLR